MSISSRSSSFYQNTFCGLLVKYSSTANGTKPVNGEHRMSNRLDEFQNYRSQMNARIAAIDHLGIKRFFNLDTAAYNDGALTGKTKELLGLAASMVLRCNDCIDYHIIQCVDAGWTDEELYEAFNVALVVGGSIVIPHLRHAVETLDLYRAKKQETG
jgi:AhpD family alkylhydroperoxidase